MAIIMANKKAENEGEIPKKISQPATKSDVYKKTANTHKQAAFHQVEAAKYHEEAAKYYEAGKYEKAAHSSFLAYGLGLTRLPVDLLVMMQSIMRTSSSKQTINKMEDFKNLEFLAVNSKEIIEKQVDSYRQQHSYAGTIIGATALYIPFFLGGFDGTY